MSGLTSESLEALLAFLDPEDRDRAGTHYETIRRRLVRLFEWRGFGNAEDLADETMDRVARRIHEGVTPTSDPYAYFCGVAQFLSKEVARRAARERAALEQDALLSAPPADDDEEEDDRRVCLRLCLERLPNDQRLLVLRYHQDDDHIRSRQMLSRELGVPMNALRIRVHRIRRKLEDCVQACLSRGREAQSPMKRISRFRHPWIRPETGGRLPEEIP